MDDIAERLRFDPTRGNVIASPPGTGYGHWVGGSKVSYDSETGTYALFYRERTPLEMGRGGRCVVAMSSDGIHFDPVWEATKEHFDSTSIEVGHVVPHGPDEWRLYVSYERATQKTWRIDVMEAEHPSRFDTQARRTVLEPGHFGVGFIKDPWIIRSDDGAYELYAAVPARSEPRLDGDSVWIRPEDATVRAHSDDGLYFPAITYVFEAPGTDTWDGHRARLDSLFRLGESWVGTYSGGRTMYDNYEEPCGLIVSEDGESFTRVDTGGPWIRSPYGCVRYVYGLVVGRAAYFYYEYTRADGSHDLRVSTVDL